MDFIVRHHSSAEAYAGCSAPTRHKAREARGTKSHGTSRPLPCTAGLVCFFRNVLLTHLLSPDISRPLLRGPRSDLDSLHPAVAHLLPRVLPVWNTAVRRYLQELVLLLELMGAQVTEPRQLPAASPLLAVRVAAHESADAEQLLQPIFWRSAWRQAVLPI